MIEALVLAGCYAAFWSSFPGLDTLVRPLIFVFLILASVSAIFLKKLRPVAATPTEVLLYAIGIVSAIVAVLRAVDYSIYYSMYFMTAIVCISVIARSVSYERLLNQAALLIVLCAVTAVVFDWRDLIECLSISVSRTGMQRFGPLGSHPLLTGYIFGSGSILVLRRAYLARRTLERWIMTGATLLCWIIVLAASARSAVAGLFAAALFAVVVEFRFLSGAQFKRFGWIAAVIVAAIALYLAMGGTYLQNILEVNSSSRGIGSGATGRTELWAKGIDVLTSDPTLIAFGGGLRSSDYMVIGFLTENSYITILLDSGIFLGSALVLLLVSAPFRTLRQSRATAVTPNPLAFSPSFFVFLLVQCFFVRYFIGLGNPAALITLMLLVSLSMRPGFQKITASAPSSAIAADLAGLARSKP